MCSVDFNAEQVCICLGRALQDKTRQEQQRLEVENSQAGSAVTTATSQSVTLMPVGTAMAQGNS